MILWQCHVALRPPRPRWSAPAARCSAAPPGTPCARRWRRSPRWRRCGSTRRPGALRHMFWGRKVRKNGDLFESFESWVTRDLPWFLWSLLGDDNREKSGSMDWSEGKLGDGPWCHHHKWGIYPMDSGSMEWMDLGKNVWEANVKVHRQQNMFCGVSFQSIPDMASIFLLKSQMWAGIPPGLI